MSSPSLVLIRIFWARRSLGFILLVVSHMVSWCSVSLLVGVYEFNVGDIIARMFCVVKGNLGGLPSGEPLQGLSFSWECLKYTVVGHLGFLCLDIIRPNSDADK